MFLEITCSHLWNTLSLWEHLSFLHISNGTTAKTGMFQKLKTSPQVPKALRLLQSTTSVCLSVVAVLVFPAFILMGEKKKIVASSCTRRGSWLGIRKKLFLERVVIYWSRLPREEVVKSLSLEEFKKCGNVALKDINQWPWWWVNSFDGLWDFFPTLMIQ